MAVGEAFGREQQLRVTRAVADAERQSGLRLSVFLGAVPDGVDVRDYAVAQLTALAPDDVAAVLVAVDPAARRVEVVTTAAARRRLADHACALATLSMTTSFGVGDLVGGLTSGLRMLADAAGPAPVAAPRRDPDTRPAALGSGS